MKHARRLLALLLCLLLAAGPWMTALSQEAEPSTPEARAELAPQADPEAAPLDADAPEAEPDGAAAPDSAPADDSDPEVPAEGSDADGAPSPDSTPNEAEEGAGAEEENPSPEQPELPETSPSQAEEQPDDSESGGGALRVPFAELALGIGEKRSIGASFSDGKLYPIRYASDNPQIASVAEDGTVTALAEGAAVISLESERGGAKVSVSVRKRPTRIRIVAARRAMGAPEGDARDSLQLSVSLEPADAASGLRFSSSKKSVASVDERGVVTALGRGSATITVKTYNGKKATIKLSVRKAPQSVALSGCAPALGLGETGALAVSLNSGSAGGCQFESSDPDVLAVDPETGALTAVAIGSATLRARTYNGKAAELDVAVKAAPESLTLRQTEATLGVGEYMPLPESLLAADGAECAGGVSFISSDPGRAAILDDGRIKGRKAGDVTITAESYNHLHATLLLHVAKAPSRLALTAHHRTLGVGEVLALGYRFKPGDAASKLSFVSSKPSIATVDESGAVTGVSPGAVKIGAKTFNKKGASVKLTVVPQPESVDLPDELALGLGERYALQPTLLPAGSGGGIRFWVEDEAIAEIDSITGAITAKALGETAVHVELYNGLSDTCRLTVRGAPTGIALQDGNFYLSLKDTYQLQPPILAGGDVASGLIRYKSSAKCVKISQSGLLTAAKTGKATITVSTYNGLKASLKVRVRKAPKSISFAEDSHRLFIDHEFTPEVRLSNGAVGNYSLTSSNPAVAAIGEDGRSVRGVSGGTATVTATAYNGKTDAMEIRVPFLPDSVALDPAALELGAGDRGTLRAVMPEGQGAELFYESDDPAIATVEQQDNETISVVAHSAGSANITVRSQNGREGAAKLTVREAPTALSLSPSSAGRSLAERELQLRVGFGAPGEGGRVEFASGDESIATVDANGLVRFRSTGSVQITAKSYNGHIATCQLKIGSKPGRMTFEQAEFTVALGDTVRLPASFDRGCEGYSLSAEDEAVLSASGEEVTALAIGETRVTATSYSGLEASCAVRVVEAPEGVELNRTSAELMALVGETLQLRATALPGGVGSVHYASSDPSVAAVDWATGLVTPLGSGNCAIRAITYDGKHSAECAVHVRLPLEGVKIGIDPGHQAKGDLRMEKMSPNSKLGSKYRCSYSGSGVAHVSEHKINLKVGLLLRDALTRLGAEVYMTRETANVNISNKERAQLMNRLGVDFVLRIHCNSGPANMQGFYMVRRKTCAYSSSEVDGGWVKGEEKRLGNAIARRFRAATGCKWRGFSALDSYTMNNWAKMPCLLLELGFMSHPKEGKRLVKADYQQKMVVGMVNGICDYEGVPIPVEW